ncbi:MAG: sigma-70 family RNA polymerase sigma factor [Nitrospira sp.]
MQNTIQVREKEWAQLITQTAQGDQAALATLYDRSSPQVYGLIFKILGQREAAEEVTLDVYTQVWKQAHTFDETRGTPGGWLMMLARTRAIDRFRSGLAERGKLEDLDMASFFSSEDPTPDQEIEVQQRQQQVRQALSLLSAEQREAIALGYFYGLSQSEIADKLGLPLGTVKTRMRLGMIKLREALEPHKDELLS